MYWKCLLSITVLFQLIAIISIFVPVGWLHASSLTLLISIFILGNVLTVFFKSKLTNYCRINALTVDVGNIIGHIVIPLLIATVLVWKHRHQSNIMSWKHAGLSTGLIIGVGLLYFVLSMFGWVCSYGVGRKTQVWFLVAWVILAMVITPLSLYVFNK